MINVPYDFKGFIYSKEGYWTYEPFLFFTEKMTDSCDREDKDTMAGDSIVVNVLMAIFKRML